MTPLSTNCVSVCGKWMYSHAQLQCVIFQVDHVQKMDKEQLYPLAWEDDPSSMGQRGVFYWEQMKDILTERLSSKMLKEVRLFQWQG